MKCPIICETECNGITTNQKFVLECNHIFHVNCITPWLSKNNLTCPCCRTIVSQEFMNKHNINVDITEKIVSAYEHLIFHETSEDTLLLRYIRLFDISLQIFSNEIISRSYIIKYISKKTKNKTIINDLAIQCAKIKDFINKIVSIDEMVINKQNTLLLEELKNAFVKITTFQDL